MQSTVRRLAAVLITAVAASLPLHAQTTRQDELDEAKANWQEIDVQLPAMPEAANLLPFDVSAAATQKSAIDGKSLSVGVDGVVRFTLVTISQAGARNISYEGIRCASHERKLYALGRADGSWSRARRDEWQPIANNAINRQQAALAQDYFCLDSSLAGSATDMLKRLQRQQTLTAESLR